MAHDDRFRATHLALLALCWQALEQIDQLLRDACDAWATPRIEERLQWLRLELLQLRASTTRCHDARQLSAAQLERVQAMVSTVLEWLDFDAATPLEVVRLRVAEAQNWLLEETLDPQPLDATTRVATAPARSAV